VSAVSQNRQGTGLAPRTKRIAWIVAVILIVVAMGFGTKVVGAGSALATTTTAFSAQAYGKTEFPKVQAVITKRAVDAATLAAAIAADQAAAGTKYGVNSGAGAGPEISVSLTGTLGTSESGIYPVTVPGLPQALLVRVQTGPAINGTDLRDAPGTIAFGDFSNQIDYQNAASALNDQLKKQVLSKVDAASLTGKTVSIVGAFQLINPNAWLITPVSLEVK
jgi:predicted lipoprotein